MRYAPRLLPVGLLSLSALVACTDQLEAPTATLRSTTPLEANGPLRDAEIDRSDTHFGARVVTTTEESDGASLRAAGEAQLTASEDEVYIEGGFGRDGRMRFSVYFESAAESPRIGMTRLVGNDLYMYGRDGAFLSMQHIDQAMAAAGLPSGDFSHAYFSSTPPTCPPEAAECSMFAASLQAETKAEVDSDVRVVRVRPLASLPAGAKKNVEIEQRYRRVRRASADSPEAWRLEETRRTTRVPSPSGERVTSSVTRVHYRAWGRNEGKERGRAAAREAAGPPKQSDGLPRAAASDASAAPSVDAAASSVIARSAADQDAAALSNLCARGTAQLDVNRTEVARGYSTVYQHGFCSDASGFFSFDQRLAQSVNIQRSRAFSLESTDRIESQVVTLRGLINQRTPQKQLVIGHSMGGLIARRLGQLHPEYVGGVITIGTPHQGSYLADFGVAAASEVLIDKADAFCWGSMFCGFLADVMTADARKTLLFGENELAPALQDMRPGSAFLRTLNSTAETFPRVSIDVNVRSRWAIARMIADSRSPQERLLTGERPSGDARVTAVENFYATNALFHRAAQFAIFSPYLMSAGIDCRYSGYQMSWPGCNNPFAYQNAPLWISSLLMWLIYEATGVIMDAMNAVDDTWTLLTTKDIDEGDGLIHLASQRYPNAPGTFTPQRVSVKYESADSHSGQLKSPGVVAATVTSIALIEYR